MVADCQGGAIIVRRLLNPSFILRMPIGPLYTRNRSTGDDLPLAFANGCS